MQSVFNPLNNFQIPLRGPLELVHKRSIVSLISRFLPAGQRPRHRALGIKGTFRICS